MLFGAVRNGCIFATIVPCDPSRRKASQMQQPRRTGIIYDAVDEVQQAPSPPDPRRKVPDFLFSDMRLPSWNTILLLTLSCEHHVGLAVRCLYHWVWMQQHPMPPLQSLSDVKFGHMCNSCANSLCQVHALCYSAESLVMPRHPKIPNISAADWLSVRLCRGLAARGSETQAQSQTFSKTARQTIHTHTDGHISSHTVANTDAKQRMDIHTSQIQKKDRETDNNTDRQRQRQRQ